MKYLIYLRGSLKRRTFRHLALFLILTCAMAMPLMVSIYRNSDLEGTRTEIRETTGGHYIHVENAKEEEFALITDIPGLTASWDDGTVYLDADAGMENLTPAAVSTVATPSSMPRRRTSTSPSRRFRKDGRPTRGGTQCRRSIRRRKSI